MVRVWSVMMESRTSVAPLVSSATPEQVEAYFRDRRKRVLTFVGYYRSGYQNTDKMLADARGELAAHLANETIVNIGALSEGIGLVYEIAKRMGFETTGIVSTRARGHESDFSVHVDRVFIVEDETWGGFLAGTDMLSPTSRAVVLCSDLVVGIGGDAVTRDELIAARLANKTVKYIVAEMNHKKAIRSARMKGQPDPTDFRGAAHSVFGSHGSKEQT